MEALRAQFPSSNFSLLAVVLLLPALGALVNGLFGRRLGREGVRLMALAAIGGSFLASLGTFLMLPHGEGGEHLSWTVWRWFSVTGRMQQEVPIDVAFSVDAMSATMMLVITGVGFLIHLYATEYMRGDDGYARFFAYLNLFCFAMLVLVTADNLAVLFVGWEGVGMCSYLLIGFWFDEEKNATAGRKAFIVNRIGDFGLILATAMLVYYVGALHWDGIRGNAQALLTPVKIWPIGNLSHESLPVWIGNLIIPDHPVMVYASTLVALALFLGCAGKSAQIPLYVWLPDAMAGPTPVSALIHAATMVTAGVYLVARLNVVFLLSPAAMATVAVVGTATALFAASIGLLQRDLKKVLAYSTVSQLGFMFIGVGVGAFSAGFFHVFTHAFFKACLFLGAGSVIHTMHAGIHDSEQSQDMRNMGGLRRYLPVTHWTFLIACLSISGFPLFAGFWSKDEILWKAFSTHLLAPTVNSALPLWQPPPWFGQAIYWAGIVAATMTAFYMFRAYFMTFHGEFRGWKIVKRFKPAHGHDAPGTGHDEGPRLGPVPREAPLAMTLPLAILAAFAAFGGFLNAELVHSLPLGHLLEPVFAHTSVAVAEREGVKALEIPMLLPGVAAFLIGSGAAMLIYWNKQGAPERAFAKSLPRLYQLILDKWRIDELYEATVIGMVDALADIFTMADTWIIDGVLAKLSAGVVRVAGTVLRAFQTGRMQAYSASMVLGLAGVGWFVIWPHAAAEVADANVALNGEVVLTPAPGPGYSYRWKGPGVPTGSKDFSTVGEVKLKLDPGERREVVLEVKNAFDLVSSRSFSFARSGIPRGGVIDLNNPQVPQMPTGPVPGNQIPDLLRQKALQ